MTAENSIVCGKNGRHYEVISPEMVEYHQSWDPPEPPDYYRCWGLYLAPNAKAAKAMAVKDPEFREWVTEARVDGVPPFKGLEARRTLCEHGVCWGCGDQGEDSFGCPECDKAAEIWDVLADVV